MDILSRAPLYTQPLTKKKSDLFSLIGIATINCNSTLSNQKIWSIFQVDPATGADLQQIILSTNPTINYAELVLQPNTFSNGLYRFVYTLTMTNTDSTILSSQVDSYVKIDPSGLVISSLSLSQPIYGGTIEISRGQMQAIPFNPYLFSYDIDGLTVITTLIFKYACQIIDSNIENGYPILLSSNQLIYLDDIMLNPTGLKSFDKCFVSTSDFKMY